MKLLMGSLILCLFFINPTVGQICNSKDKFSGGLFLPAFCSGGAQPKNITNGKDWPTPYCDFVGGLQVDFDCEVPASDPQPMAIVYLLLLLWTFMGVGLFADVFMGAIEVITSRKKYIEIDEGGETKQIEIYVWNATVANLTLMALGSSAPEILLSVVEICSGKFFSGALGPSTIVGSAAFNLYVILAVCVVAIPKPSADGSETGFRKIEQIGVFYVTAFSSVFAYVWLLIILMVITPNVVTLGEALITFAFFPILVILCYAIDSGKLSGLGCGKGSSVEDTGAITGMVVEEDGEGQIARFKDIHEVDNLLKGTKIKDKNPQYLAQVAIAKKYQKTRISRAQRRVNAGRMLTGGKPVIPVMPNASQLSEKEVDVVEQKQAVISFESIQYSIREGDGNVEITVVCQPTNPEEKLNGTFTVDYATGDLGDTATADQDYESKKGTLTFKDGQLKQKFKITIIEDDEEEENEIFTVKLSKVTGDASILETMNFTKVTIIDDDSPGVISFRAHKDVKATEEEKKKNKDLSVVYRCGEDIGHVSIKVIRANGSKGTVSVKYATEDGCGSTAAMAGNDYMETRGTLEFGPTETEKIISVPIIDDEEFEKDEVFYLKLSHPEGCSLGSLKVAKIIIENDDEMHKLGEQVLDLLNMNLDKYKLGSNNWKDQFAEAIELPPQGSSCFSKFLHILNVPWKLLAALIPPTNFMGGWICFFISLSAIGLTTAFIGDIAGLFGCSVGLKDAVTAITFVALGTSLPDTFASQTAAVGDPTADNAIGNVTGSNSVNVFLGLGMPWTIAAIYWASGMDDLKVWSVRNVDFVDQYPGGVFVVNAGALGFSVTIFVVFAIITLLVVWARGQFLDGELGGRYTKPTAALFVLMWFLYVLLSILYCEGLI